MFRRIAACVTGFALSVAVVGCGSGPKYYSVEGIVTVDGQPLEGATVTFQNDKGLAVGMTSASGKFKLLSGGQEGALGGTYKVTVKKVEVKTADTTSAGGDPTKAYLDYMKANNAKMEKGTFVIPKPKSEIPEKYSQPGAIPDQVVPASGEIKIELSGLKK